MTPALSTSKLCVGYRSNKNENRLFENLNLTLHRGCLTCFMGPNGIGKSTLIRTLAGIQSALSGEVSPIDEKTISLVLTDRIQSATMTVGELVEYGRYPYLSWTLKKSNEDKTHIQNALHMVQIGHLADQRIAELSDGQMQLVMIARALAQDTPLLLLDEPTAHLDLNNRVEIMRLLRKIARDNNKGLLVATHELDLALQTADIIWLATSERTIKTGLPEDLVLDGSFDEVFQFKGFDLKTGKMTHDPFRKEAVQLVGDGPVYLWTKNALERTGYEIETGADTQVIVDEGMPPRWRVLKRGKSNEVDSVKKLLEVISNRS
jgi:iron complex transport system ATP-binding protein